MKATKFIKDAGLERAKAILSAAPKHANYFETYPLGPRFYLTDVGCYRAISIHDLQRLVESVDLVKTYGGFEQCRKDAEWVVKAKLPETDLFKELKQAIADYELIYQPKCIHGFDVACLICGFGTIKGERVYRTHGSKP
ncbi:hypothetical protein [Acinetobacter pittii]|uniref:hypothetical protein n=1 Tax=Acinetobacter pittii TaxID=48296 RepID=UPI0008381168|nr:hypothetical protein [Acinetobacter pittii]OCY17616.1 hypothetical protein BFR65_15245 [Acinetobacter pittii]OCZ36156.1 hypothetical protein BFR71_13680 [Acinetobacter pittii]OCZ44261.1 hypothetical protein BFR72_10095 [Acinetobacter pittii]